MKYEIQDPAIRELTHQELENVSGGGVVSAVVGAVKELANDVVNILSTGAIGGVGNNAGPNGGGGMVAGTHA